MMRILWFFIFSISNSQAATCINAQGIVDANCQCARTGACLINKAEDGQIYRSLGATGKALEQNNAYATQVASSIFTGTFKADQVDWNKLEKNNQKYNQVTAKIIARHEAKLKSQGSKVWEISKRIQIYNKLLERNINPKVASAFVNNDILGQFVSASLGMKYQNISNNSSSTQLAQKKVGLDLNQGAETNVGDNSQNVEQAAVVEDDKYMDKKYVIENDIVRNPEVDLFRVISNRYGQHSTELQSANVKKPLSKEVQSIVDDIAGFIRGL